MDFSRDMEDNTVTIGGHTVSLPATPYGHEVFGEVLVLLLGKPEGTDKVTDIELPSLTRNIVGFDHEGQHLWTISALPDATEDQWYSRLWRFSDRCVARRGSFDDGILVEIDPSTSEIIETFPLDTFRLNGNLRSFETAISFFTFNADRGMIKEPSDTYFDDYVIAFDKDETMLWRENFVSTSLKEVDGKLIASYEAGFGGYIAVEYDPDTGKPVAIAGTAFPTKQDLKNHTPESLHHLVKEYFE